MDPNPPEDRADDRAPGPPVDAGRSGVDGSGPPAPGITPTEARSRRSFATSLVWAVLCTLLVATAGAVAVGSFVHAPYVVYAPGRAVPTQPTVTVPDRETYETDGDVLFLTVSLRGASRRVGYSESLYSWLHPDQDVFPRRAILGDQTGKENRQEAVAEMTTSQEVATAVALDHLGYDVTYTGTGVTIAGTVPGSPAADVLRRGDVLVEVDGTETGTDVALRAVIAEHQPGDVVEVVAEREGERIEGSVELITDPSDPDRTLLGVVGAVTRGMEIHLPFEVNIDTEDVGGPSAGLALTLAVLDVLTPGSLSGGHDVAVTGTIELDGTVGPVGGVQQKSVAATNADAELLLVPELEVGQANLRVGDGVRVVGVATLDDALKALADIGGNALDLDRSGG